MQLRDVGQTADTMLATLTLLTLLAGSSVTQEAARVGSIAVQRRGAEIHFTARQGLHSAVATSSSLHEDTRIKSCVAPGDPAGTLCWSWPSGEGNSTLRITPHEVFDCTHKIWADWEDTANLSYCLRYGHDQWYGGAERGHQAWPVQGLRVDQEPYTTRPQAGQAVVDPYWLSSSGMSYYVYPGVPLFVDSNNLQNDSLCLMAHNTAPYLPRTGTTLDFNFCMMEDPVTAHKHSLDLYLGKPSDIPDELMMRYPIFCTWAQYRRDINESVVTAFAHEILDNRFPISQLVIDDKWAPCYGAMEVDTVKFPDMKRLTDTLHGLGIRSTMWMHPFINPECEPHFTQAKNEGRLVATADGTLLAAWWNGMGASVDLTNATTAQWWVERVQRLQAASGLDSFKFDAGESGWLPQVPVLPSVPPEQFPDAYSVKFLEAIAPFGRMIEARVGKRTQFYPFFLRMIDKDSRWGLDNGLQSIVTTMLQMNIAGYPFVLPDMIGGNVYGSDKVSKELFIRWLQANTFMPALQFSVVPWDFDQETVDISRKFVNLHAQYADTIIAAARRAAEDGTPINPPIWWIAADDPQAHKCWDEFLLGDSLLVAPVLEEGATARDIYLPAGTWVDLTRGQNTTIEGPTTLLAYPAALDELPYFLKTA